MAINTKNFKEKLTPLFEKFPQLKENFCVNCLNLTIVDTKYEDENIKNCDAYKMDTGVCSKCGETNDVVNLLIYSVAKVADLKIYGVTDRIYFES